MANYVSANIHFEGEKSQLEKVEKLIVKEGRFSSKVIDFSHVQPMLPGIEDKYLFKLFGCDWDRFVMEEYSDEDKLKYQKKVDSFVKSEGWIGLRDNYVNESSREVTSTYQDDKLIITSRFSWYCPSLFFFKVAEDFGIKVKILEFVEGNNTIISYLDSSGEYFDVTNSNQAILHNKDFRDISIELNLHKPSELVATAMLSNEFLLAKELIKTYNVDSNSMQESFEAMIKYPEDFTDIYKSSAFVDLDRDTLENLNIEESMTSFTELLNTSKKTMNNN